ncbi:hypothetical protein [Microseira wollei]|uniref:hypothetical protein n=1 Tax=Microseira wollei TaxID=467598 RepID=UPI001CFC656B|nr:hypothetical protein [Microseira wollei]
MVLILFRYSDSNKLLQEAAGGLRKCGIFDAGKVARRCRRRRHPEGCGYTNEVRLRGLKNQRFKSLRRQALFV